MRCTVAYDFAGATTGNTVGTPRQGLGAAASIVSTSGNIAKFQKGRHRVARIIAVPKLTAAQRAGAAADVVAFRDGIDSHSFIVTSGGRPLIGPVHGTACSDPLPNAAGATVSDPGGTGDGFAADGDGWFLGETGIVAEVQRNGTVLAIPFTLLVELELTGY